MKKLSKLLGLMLLLAGTIGFISCGGDDPTPEPVSSDPTIELNNIKSIIASSDSDIEVPIVISCESFDELSDASATIHKADGSVLKNITKGEMEVTTVSSQKWDVKISSPYDKDAKKIKVSAKTKNGGEKIAEFQITHGSAGMKIKVKFTSGYDKDFNPTSDLKTAEWEFGWAKMEVGVKPGSDARIDDVIYITACKDPEGAAETYEEYETMLKTNRELLPHRFMLYTYVTDQKSMYGEIVKDEDGVESTNFQIQYLEGDYFMHGTSAEGDQPSFEWHVYNKGLDLGKNSKFTLKSFDKKGMVISGYCEVDLYNMHQLTASITEENASKAKLRIDFENIKLTTVENPWWSVVYKMPLREDK